MKLGFATDIHLDHIKVHRGTPNQIDLSKITRVGQALTKGVDALVLGGDLSVGHLLKEHMAAFLKKAECPVYFVLGNHDMWCAHEDQIWEDAKSFEGSALDFMDYVELDSETALVGVSGWYDTRAGNLHQPGIIMPEFELTTRLMNKGPIKAFRHLIWPPERLHEVHQICKNWADEQTKKFLPKLEMAAKKYRKVFVVTHIPPWVEVCWSEGGRLSRDCSPEWLPWSVNVGLGMQLEALAEDYPEVQFRVLSGHTHGEGVSDIAWNIRAYSGKAQYKQPKMARVFDTEDTALWEPKQTTYRDPEIDGDGGV
jgi:predicted phosphohydrolase